MTPTAPSADRLREAERAAAGPVDWVEEATGVPGPSWCLRHGHAWVREVADTRIVYGRPACPTQCRTCGVRGFHWLPDESDAGAT